MVSKETGIDEMIWHNCSGKQESQVLCQATSIFVQSSLLLERRPSRLLYLHKPCSSKTMARPGRLTHAPPSSLAPSFFALSSASFCRHA